MSKKTDFVQGYQSALAERYASPAMQYNFSVQKKFRTWRSIWIALAESEKALGLPITAVQISQLKRFRDRINYDRAKKYEQTLRHEVVAHIKAYGDQCPKARPIIHLGATSALVMDNTDLITARDGLTLIKKRLLNVISALAKFAQRYKNLATLGSTHYQPALVTTVGRRACLWLNELLSDLKNLEFVESQIQLLGAKGAIGTQASFLALLNNASKVKQLDRIFIRKLGFDSTCPISSQTYSRKWDYQMLSALSGIAQSAHKFSNDIRLLQGQGELEEPFGRQQVGSSAMAHKRNPMRSERMAALARFVMVTTQNTAFTAAQQWLERTLDDSANRRLVIPEAFLATEAVLNLYLNVASGLQVYPLVIKKHLVEELPFLATEDILTVGVKQGGNRQVLHERLRVLSMQAAQRIKQGQPNDLFNRLQTDPVIGKIIGAIKKLINPERYSGLARQQTESFLKQHIKPVLKRYQRLLGEKVEIKV